MRMFPKSGRPGKKDELTGWKQSTGTRASAEENARMRAVYCPWKVKIRYCEQIP